MANLIMLGIGETPLSTYLNDHLAGATAAVNLARRAADQHRSTSFGRALETLAEEIETDRRALLVVMGRLAVAQDQVKLALGRAAEKATGLILALGVLGPSSASRLKEIEALALGVEGKLALWKTLRRNHGRDPRLREFDFEELIRRAQSQRRRLEDQRTSAADEAFG